MALDRKAKVRPVRLGRVRLRPRVLPARSRAARALREGPLAVLHEKSIAKLFPAISCTVPVNDAACVFSAGEDPIPFCCCR